MKSLKKAGKRKALSILLAVTMLMVTVGYNDIVASAVVTEEEQMDTQAEMVLENISFEELLPENDELFAGYVQQCMYGESGIVVLGNFGSDKLTGLNKELYDKLKVRIAEVAAGTAASTKFEMTASDFETAALQWTLDELNLSNGASSNEIESALQNKLSGLGMDMSSLIDYLSVDCPYELYWFDKTKGVSFGYGYSTQNSGESTTVSVTYFSFEFNVAQEYAPDNGDGFTVDTDKTKSAGTAATNAANIVKECESLSVYEKLAAYKNKICDLVSYNNDAANDATDTPYGNPWQLIWVFDGDDATNVVCEGYAKAFQYLCDLTGITCYTVTGTMSGGTGAGAHMWNIVTMADGKNYLVDVTNCDTGTVGAPDGLFLAGLSGSMDTEYTYNTPSGQTVQFTYDDDTKNMYGSTILTLADTKYNPAQLEGSVTLEGNAVYGEVLTANTEGVQSGAVLTYSFYREGSDSAVQQGANSTYTVTADDIGKKISVTVTADGCTGELTAVSSSVEQRTIKVETGSYEVSKVYDGTKDAGTGQGSLNITGILSADSEVTVLAVPEAYTDANVGGQSTVKVSLSLTGTGSECYRLENTTVETPCSIAPKTINPVITVKGTYKYTGSSITPEIEVKYSEMSSGAAGEYILESNQYTAEYTDNINAGTGKVSVVPAAGGNYTWSDAATASFTIDKADYKGTTSVSVSAGYGSGTSYDMASLLPAGWKLGDLKVSDPDNILDGTPSVDNTVLNYKFIEDSSIAGKTAVITVPVTDTNNYSSFELVITVAASQKQTQNLQFESSAISKTYGCDDFVNSLTGYVTGAEVTYVSSDPTVAAVDNQGNIHVLKAGETVITATASGTADYEEAQASFNLKVEQVVLSWDTSELTAADTETDIIDKQATLTGSLKITGILADDAQDVIFICPAGSLKGTYAAVAAGTQRVTLAWADAPVVLSGDKAVNYVLPDTLPEITGTINKSDTSTNETTVDTGDVSGVMAYFILAVASASLIVMMLYRKRAREVNK